MNLKQLEAFVYVANTGSFSEAAKMLYLTQPTVSSHIAGLEKELNALLLIRNTRGVRLSEKGKTLYTLARQMLDTEKQIKQEFGLDEGAESNEIRMAVSTIPGQYVLPKLLAEFSKKCPDLQFALIEGDSSDVMECVTHGRVELGFAGTVAQEGLHCKSVPFYRDELMILTPPETRFSVYKGRAFDLELLYREPVILREVGSGTRTETERYLDRNKIELSKMKIVASMSNQEAIKKAVENGMGVTIMSEAAAKEEIKTGRVYAFPFPGDRLVRYLQIIHLEDFKLSKPAQKFVQYVQESCRNAGYLQNK